MTVQADDDTYEQYYAWGQPVLNEGLLALRASAVGAATPGALLAGRPTPLEVSVVLDDSGETAWAFQQLALDLSPYAGPSEVLLHHTGGGRYVGSAAVTSPTNGSYRLCVMMETAQEEWLPLLRVPLAVYPDGDLSIYEDGLSEGWTVDVTTGQSDSASSAFVHSGSFSHEIAAWSYLEYVSEEPEGIAPFGYSHLVFWVNGGQGSGQDPKVAGIKLSDLEIVPEANTWTRVTISASALPDPLSSISITLASGAPFYLDDMKLVAEQLPTAVEEVTEAAPVPLGYALSQNVPNPFNSATTIAYDLPEPAHVTLAIYNLTGQHVATLLSARQRAGRHEVSWDARGLGTGLYFYRLRAGTLARTRRMVLLK